MDFPSPVTEVYVTPFCIYKVSSRRRESHRSILVFVTEEDRVTMSVVPGAVVIYLSVTSNESYHFRFVCTRKNSAGDQFRLSYCDT